MIRGRALMTLNKKQEKYLFVGTSIFVLLVLFVVVFICPNFYMQYRVVLHPEPIIDVTDDEREIIKNNIDFLLINFKKQKNNEKIKLNNEIKNFDVFLNRYDYIIIDTDEVCEKSEILEKSDEIIIMVEANLLGISESKQIIEETIGMNQNQKDNIKIVFNKQNEMSISKEILKFMFEDFTILGILHYDKHYNLLINSNAKIINSKIKKEFLKIIKNI